MKYTDDANKKRKERRRLSQRRWDAIIQQPASILRSSLLYNKGPEDIISI